MEEVIHAILYGCLPVELPKDITPKDQLEIVRAISVNPSALSRLKYAEFSLLKRYIEILKLS